MNSAAEILYIRVTSEDDETGTTYICVSHDEAGIYANRLADGRL